MDVPSPEQSPKSADTSRQNLEAFAPEVDLPIDPGIRRAVLLLRKYGIHTVESCQGGEGHPSPEPMIFFDGDFKEGARAVAIARGEGLPVLYLRRSWPVETDGSLTPPCWQIVFCPSITAELNI